MSAPGLWENRDVDQGRKRAQTAAAAAASGLVALQWLGSIGGNSSSPERALFIDSHSHDLPPHPL